MRRKSLKRRRIKDNECQNYRGEANRRNLSLRNIIMTTISFNIQRIIYFMKNNITCVIFPKYQTMKNIIHYTISL